MLPITVTSFSALMLYAAYSDLKSYTLPNFISILLVTGFGLVLLVTQPSFETIAWHVGVGVVVFIIGYILFELGVFGGGDVKVVAALAPWFGPSNFLAFFTIMSLAGGVLALLLFLFRRYELPEKWKKSAMLRGLHDPNEGIPYGVAIAIGALWEFPKTEIFRLLAGS